MQTILARCFGLRWAIRAGGRQICLSRCHAGMYNRMLNTRSGSTSVSVSEMASCTVEPLSVVERTRHDASTSRRRLKQPAAAQGLRKDPHFRPRFPIGIGLVEKFVVPIERASDCLFDLTLKLHDPRLTDCLEHSEFILLHAHLPKGAEMFCSALGLREFIDLIDQILLLRSEPPYWRMNMIMFMLLRNRSCFVWQSLLPRIDDSLAHGCETKLPIWAALLSSEHCWVLQKEKPAGNSIALVFAVKQSPAQQRRN
jgi:hypothetical protein